MTQWNEVGATGSAPHPRLAGHSALLVPLLVAGAMVAILVAKGRSGAAIGLAVVVIAVTIARRVSPRFNTAAGGFLAAFAHVVERVLSVVLLLAVFVVIVVPLWLVARITAWHTLEPVRRWRGQWNERVPWWQARPVQGFTREPSRPALTRVHGIAAVLVCLAVAVGAAYTTYQKLGSTGGPSPLSAAVVDPGAGVFSGYFALAAYEGQPWARQYFIDLGSIPFLYDPYLVLRTPDDYASEHVNIVHRARRSYEPPEAGDDPNAVNVWFFGGSTMFGVGQRDEHTIASEFVRAAAADGITVRAQNFAMSGYVTWQDDLLMAQMLEQRDPPDLIVDYGGGNDMVLYMRDGGPADLSNLFADQVHTVLDAAGNRVFGPDLPDYIARNGDLSTRNAMRLYGQEVDFGRRIAGAWDIPIAHFFQPVLWTTTQQASIDPVLQAKELTPRFYARMSQVWEAARGELPDGVVDLADSLDDVSQPVYADTVHTNEEGARLVALDMYGELEARLRELQSQN